jgi:hypothetical protein
VLRRLWAIVLPGFLLAAATAVAPAPAGGQVDHEDLRRGLVYEGLQRVARSHLCRGNFTLRTLNVRGMPVCTHGPDPAPEGVDVRQDREPPVVAADSSTAGLTGAAGATQVPCVGNGTDGYRVQLIYARASDKADGYTAWLPSFRQYAAQMDDVFNASAAETGGVRHVRFVHDASCVPVIHNVVLSRTGDDSFDNLYSELQAKGYTRSDRKYLVWIDASVYCGIAEIYYDDQPGPENDSNGVPWVPGEIGAVGKGCWGASNSVEAHELVHLLGGVQTSAPHATPGNHCTDNHDRLCYADGTGFPTVVCSDPAHENRLDCRHDDYYSTNPRAGSYLATHWNTANNRFLTASGSTSSTTTTAPPPTTTTTRPPTTTSTTTTTRPPTSTTTTTTTTSTTVPPPTTSSLPSAPQNLYSTQPTSGRGVLLWWAPPASPGSPPFTTYRIFRGPSATSLTKLVDMGTSTSTYTDTATTTGVLYWYAVAAVNSAGQGPLSNLTRMIAK